MRELIYLLPLLLAAPLLADPLQDPREVHLADVRQLTAGGENAEGYWSPDGREIVYQARPLDGGCDQIYRLEIAPDGSPAGEPVRVSTGTGRTTCSYFTYPAGDRVLFSSTHATGPECPPPPDRSQGYVWPIYSSYEIWSARPDGTDLRRLTENEAYDAEATVCRRDGAVVFTSARDGDLELYRMDADGGNVKRLTETPGYDGGAFFSPDCSKIVWRASRPQEGSELDDYHDLLARGLVRPGKLELWVAEADGSEPRQVTYLGAASFAPSFFPSGERILFSSNAGDPRGREFDLWAIDTDGTDLERITHSEGFDGFPLFSPGGERLVFASNRNQKQPGETDLFVARWVDAPPSAPAPEVAALDPGLAMASRWQAAVAWLADDAREGRGIGTAGLDAASRWLAERFSEAGLEAGVEAGIGGWLQPFDLPLAVGAEPSTSLAIDGAAVAGDDWTPASFSASTAAEAEVVAVGYGITAPDLGHDDYTGLDVTGKVALVRRFVPPSAKFEDESARRRFGDLRYKAFNAREHGAAGVLIADLPAVAEGEALPDEAPLPRLGAGRGMEGGGDAGLPVALLRREVAAPLLAGGHRARLEVALATETTTAANVVGRLRGTGGGRPLLVGAHYDHLGYGKHGGSLDPDSGRVHNGADDNASGAAALIEIARLLAAERPAGDVWVVAFAGEEAGVLGSTAFTRRPPPGLAIADLEAMVNLDMVGRLRANRLSVLGAGSASELKEITTAACDRVGLACSPGGDGYGPSDQTPFYAAGVSVLHLFTGAHEQYHRPEDDAALLNPAGAARVALLAADLVRTLAARPERLTYVATAAPEPAGDERSYGASLGTIPDYAGDGRPGVLLAGTREGSAAEKAGLRRGDLLVELDGSPIGDIYDFMYVLQRSKPDQTTTAVVVREGERVTVELTFGRSSRLR